MVSGFYLLYRLVMAAIFTGIIIVFLMLQYSNGKFFIFLTNEGLLLLTIHFIIESILVLKRWTWEKLHSKHIHCKLIL